MVTRVKRPSKGGGNAKKRYTVYDEGNNMSSKKKKRKCQEHKGSTLVNHSESVSDVNHDVLRAFVDNTVLLPEAAQQDPVSIIMQRLTLVPSLKSLVETLCQYLVVPSLNLVSPLRPPFLETLPYKILHSSVKQCTGGLTEVKESLNFYLSDSTLTHSVPLQKYLKLAPHIQDETPSVSAWVSKWTNLLRKLSYGIQSCSSSFPEACHQDMYEATIAYFKRALTSRDCNLIDYANPFFSTPEPGCDGDLPIYHDKFLWFNARLLLQLPRFKNSSTTSQQLIDACDTSSDLRAAVFCLPNAQVVATAINDFIVSEEWDKSVFGRDRVSILEPFTKFNNSKNRSIGKGLHGLMCFLKCFGIHDDSATYDITKGKKRVNDPDYAFEKQLYIGRPWPVKNYLEILKDTVQQHTLFVDNLPFKCTLDILRDFLQQKDLRVRSVRMPRFSVSREPKGFAFVEMVNKEDVPKCIALLNDQPQTIFNNGLHVLSRYVTPYQRNRRPLFSCTHYEWLARKNDKKQLDILGLPAYKSALSDDEKSSSSTWVALENVDSLVSELHLQHFIRHSVVPLKVHFNSCSGKALVKLKTYVDAQDLCFDVKQSQRILGFPQIVTARLTEPPLHIPNDDY